MKRRFWLIPLVAAAITAALYARSLPLPFYSDDLVQLPWLRTATWADIWTQVTPYGYYRPLALALWKLLPASPGALRLMNLLLHALAAASVGWLANELSGQERWLPGLAAAALFAGYPFAYQVVPWVSATFYPLVVVLSVAAVIAYRRTRAGGHPGWWAVSLLATVLAPLAHENGLLTALLVALSELLFQSERRKLTWPLIYLAIGALSGAVWWFARPAGLGTLALDPTGLMQNAVFLVQGLSFPLAPIAQLFDGAAWAIWAIAIPTAALLLWAAGRRGWYALAWFALSILPVWVMMRPDWLADAPRFLYPAGVGAALLWGLALGRLEAWKRKGSQVLATVLAIAALAPGAIFAWEGVTWHLRGGEAIREAVQAAQAAPEEPLLLVNLPDRLAPARSLYPLNHGGAILLPLQVPAEAITGAQVGAPRTGDTAITAGWLLPLVDYERTTYGPTPESPDALAALISEGRRVYTTEHTERAIHLQEAGQVLAAPHSTTPLAHYGESLALVTASTQGAGDGLRVELVWLAETLPTGDETMFVHVVDARGNLIAQADGDPMMGLYPTMLWPPGAVVLDVRHIPLPEEAPAEVYVGVWLPVTGERLEAFGHDGARFPDDRVPVYNLP